MRILSAFYGVLKPMDGVTPYRLEMQARVGIGDTKNLYEYWGNLLYRSVIDDSRFIINLVTKGTYAKMARGEMVRYMAENNIENPVEIQNMFLNAKSLI